MTTDNQVITLQNYRNAAASSRRTPKVVSVTGGKGGVGKSNTSVNLAIASADLGARTLTLDGDLGMADLNLLLGVAPERSLLDVLHGVPARDVLVEAHGIHLLPALNGSLELANLDDTGRQRLFRAIDSLEQDFDLLVVDTPAGIDFNAIDFAGAASHVVVVLTSDPVSLADAYSCLKALSVRQNLKSAFVLPNMVRAPEDADEILARLSAIVDRFLGMTLIPLPAIPYDPAVMASAATGVPVTRRSPDSPAARAYRQAAAHLANAGPALDRFEPPRLFRTGAGAGAAQEI